MSLRALDDNPIPPADEESYEALKADIEVDGILTPVEYCEATGQILDGHTRRQIGEELGIDVPTRAIGGLESQAERHAYAIRRNSNRRQLTSDQRKTLRARQKELFADLRCGGHTQERCSALLGIPRRTLADWEPLTTNGGTAKGGTSRTDIRRTLTEADEEEILQKADNGQSQTSLAEAYGVTQQAISKALERARSREFKSRHLRLELPTTVAGVEVRLGDARDHLPGDSADVAVFSPPYNVGVSYDDDQTADGLPDKEWRQLVSQTLEMLRDGWQVGRIVVNLPRALDRNPYRPLEAPQVKGLALEAEIVWDKGAAVAVARTSWGSWRRSSAPAIRDRTERLYVYRTKHALRGEADACVDDGGKSVSPWLNAHDFTEWTQDVWELRPESASKVGHPAPYPVELVRRVVKLYGWPGCVVIDPFAGSGTTGVAAAELGTPAVLIDRSESYCRLALRRLLDLEAAR